MTPASAALTRTPTPIPHSPRRAFRPTAAQRRLLDHIHANPGFQTVQEICAAADVSPSSYYAWCHDPAFRAWLSHEWSACLLFEGWHMLSLARANMVRSATHFRALFSLVFDPRGQAALAGWQTRIADTPIEAPEADENTPPELQNDVVSNQSLDPENWSFSKLPTPPTGDEANPAPAPRPLNPTLVVRHLDRALQQASSPLKPASNQEEKQ